MKNIAKNIALMGAIKIVASLVMFVIAGLIIFQGSSQTDTRARRITTSASANASCGNRYVDSSSCTNPPAAVDCVVRCDANGQNPRPDCQPCPSSRTGEKQTCNTFDDTSNAHSPQCPSGHKKTCQLKCSNCNPQSECEVICGGCDPVQSGGGSSGGGGAARVATPTPEPTPAGGTWPRGTNCKYKGSGCTHAIFNQVGYPLPGNMFFCVNPVYTDAEGYKYGFVEQRPIQCDDGTACAGKYRGYHTFASGCQNPITCDGPEPPPEQPPPGEPPPTQPPGAPPPTQPPGAPPPDGPTQTPAPTPTPGPPGTCTSLSVSLERGGSVNVTSADAVNVLPRTPDPGERITINSTAGPGAVFSIYWIRPLNSPNEYIPTENNYSMASSCSFYILNPDGQPPSQSGSFTMPDWRSGTLRRNDRFGTANCGNYPINFDSGVIFGVVYLQANVGFAGNSWCRNVGPNTTGALLHVGVRNTGQACTNWCVAQSRPPSIPQSQCGLECNDQTNPCATGLQCITANNGRNYCSQPEYVDACRAEPNQTTCCSAPSPTPTPTPTPPNTPTPTPTPAPQECGYTPCNDQTAPCSQGLICLPASNGQRYCSLPQYSNACYANPSQTTCCTEPTPTPTPTPTRTPTPTPTNTPTPTFTPTPTSTPVPARCGSSCNDQIICGDGMVCVQTPNGRLCSMQNYTSACAQTGTYQACCTEPSPTPMPTYTPYPTYTPQPPPAPQTIIQRVPVEVPPQITYIQQVQPTYVPQPPPPTYTLIPTYTPYPTQPPQPTYTFPPKQLVEAGNPLPFIFAGVPVILLILGMLL